MDAKPDYLRSLPQDLSAGLVVFLVALPLCLGVALASGAPLLSGLVAGVVGGVLVSWISGSHTSVSGPAAGLTAIVATQIDQLGSFEIFLVAVVLAGVLQLGLGLLKAGSLAAFFPSSVIKGLLAAIGILLIIKQVPHLFGHDPDWFGDMAFDQPDGENTFSELIATMFHVHAGAAAIGLFAIAILIGWDKSRLKKLPIPAPLVVVVSGVAAALGFSDLDATWQIGGAHLVQVPVSGSLGGLFGSLAMPDFSGLTNPAIVTAAITVAIVASLETLLNLEAVDKLDPRKRVSPPNRELVAQGVGNITSGLLGGLPVTSVIVRSSVGINAGAHTRMSAFSHGVLLFGMVLLLPGWLNLIPLSCLAAILMVTGLKLASPKLFRQMWKEGYSQFLPFIGTVAAIVLTDLLMGIVIGMVVAIFFILKGNLRRPLRIISEHHASGEVTRIELANQVSFLNRAHLLATLYEIPHGSHVVLDARNTVYIDPDIIDLIVEFEQEIAPAHELELSLIGFQDHYEVEDRITYVDVSTREVQEGASPEHVLKLLRDGNRRFVAGQGIMRDPRRQVNATAAGQYPLAVVLACMDSRIATEMVFDLGLGDIFSIRVAGNIASDEALGSMEYGCVIAGAKLLLVMGHTRCGAVAATIDLTSRGEGAAGPPGCDHLPSITGPIAHSVRAERDAHPRADASSAESLRGVTERNVRHTIEQIRGGSPALRDLLKSGDILLVGAVYDVETGEVEFLADAH